MRLLPGEPSAESRTQRGYSQSSVVALQVVIAGHCPAPAWHWPHVPEARHEVPGVLTAHCAFLTAALAWRSVHFTQVPTLLQSGLSAAQSVDFVHSTHVVIASSQRFAGGWYTRHKFSLQPATQVPVALQVGVTSGHCAESAH
jgi:hypothetical protein